MFGQLFDGDPNTGLNIDPAKALGVIGGAATGASNAWGTGSSSSSSMTTAATDYTPMLIAAAVGLGFLVLLSTRR